MDAQLTIDFTPERAARRSDPETSKAAARKARGFAESHAGRMLLALQSRGAMTAKEISVLTGLTVVQIDRRRHELVKAGLIRIQQHHGAPVVRDGCEVMEVVRP